MHETRRQEEEKNKMERIDSDGERRDVGPGELAQYDQLEASFGELTRHILHIRSDIKQAAMEQDTQRLGALTKTMDELAKGKWAGSSPETISYIMYLINLIEEAHEWTDHNFEALEAILRQMGALLRPGHPLYNIRNFDPNSLQQDLEAAIEAVRARGGTETQDGPEENTFTTDTGVELHKVHDAETCEGPFCVMHNPAPGPWAHWDSHWHEGWRLMVRICPHGVYHVAIEEMLRMPLLGMIAHEHPAGCDCPCDFTRVVTVTDDTGVIIGFQPRP